MLASARGPYGQEDQGRAAEGSRAESQSRKAEASKAESQSRAEEGRKINCLLSDMAPNTTGIRSVDQARSEELCRKILELSATHLRSKCHLVMKLFEGPDS